MSSFEHVNFAINKKYSKKIMTIQILCFTCDLSNLQKYSFKECPLTWVVPITNTTITYHLHHHLHQHSHLNHHLHNRLHHY